MSRSGPPSSGPSANPATDGPWISIPAGARVAVVAGLSALTFPQPILDLMGRNPAFFVAGRYSTAQIVLFALAVTLVPLAVLGAVAWGTSRLGRIGNIAFTALVVALGGLFGNVVARGSDLDGGRVALIATILGGAAVYGVLRLQPGRLLLQYLSLANVMFLVGFLLMSPTSRLITGGSDQGDLGSVNVPVPPGPVVFIVFDEFPLPTLLNEDGLVDASRFPAFARLAESSTWYRNASSDHWRTERAVPELLTGTQPALDALPSHVDLPRNLMTLFATSVPVERYESITDLCPPSTCAPKAKGSLAQAVRDATVVYGHRVLPARLRSHLPSIDGSWGGFGGEIGANVGIGGNDQFAEGRLGRWFARSDEERSPATQAAILEAQGQLIDGDPALHFAHVVLPHAAWTVYPWGTQLLGAPPELILDDSDPAFEWSTRVYYQRHALQAGAADVALGTVLDRIEEVGAWEDATVVVVADHGTSTLPPLFGRDEVEEENHDEVLRVPLFIKAPGQTEGEVNDDVASTLDVLPTLVDLLDIETDWEFDGHSLIDGSPRKVEPIVGESVEPLFEVAKRHLDMFPFGSDWESMAKVGDHAALVGRPLDDFVIGPESDLTWSADGQSEFGSLPTDDGRTPQILNGSVVTPDGRRPPELVVNVNGRIGGVIGGYQEKDGRWRFGTMLAPYLVDGANEIVAYEVGEDGTLHPLRS